MGPAMHAEYEASALTREKTIAEAARNISRPLTTRPAALWVAGIAALTLVGLGPSDRSAPDRFAKHDLDQKLTYPRPSEPAQVRRLEGDLAEFQFGYVEFDWPPGSVPGFETMSPPTRSFASIPQHP
jgi:hypothetical protein